MLRGSEYFHVGPVTKVGDECSEIHPSKIEAGSLHSMVFRSSAFEDEGPTFLCMFLLLTSTDTKLPPARAQRSSNLQLESSESSSQNPRLEFGTHL